MGSIGYFPHPCSVPKKKKRKGGGRGEMERKIKTVSLFSLSPDFARGCPEC